MKTPLMKQFNEIKASYPDCIVLMELDGFFETFSDDAIKTAGTLGTILIKRKTPEETEVTGFPSNLIDTYLIKLVRAGHKVALVSKL